MICLSNLHIGSLTNEHENQGKPALRQLKLYKKVKKKYKYIKYIKKTNTNISDMDKDIN